MPWPGIDRALTSNEALETFSHFDASVHWNMRLWDPVSSCNFPALAYPYLWDFPTWSVRILWIDAVFFYVENWTHSPNIFSQRNRCPTNWLWNWVRLLFCPIWVIFVISRSSFLEQATVGSHTLGNREFCPSFSQNEQFACQHFQFSRNRANLSSIGRFRFFSLRSINANTDASFLTIFFSYTLNKPCGVWLNCGGTFISSFGAYVGLLTIEHVLMSYLKLPGDESLSRH